MNSVAFSPDGKHGVSGGCDEYEYGGCTKGLARVWEVSTGKEIARLTHEGIVLAAAFSPNGKYVASGDGKGTVVWEASTGKEVARMIHEDGVEAVAFSPDGKYVISASREQTVRVWEAATGKEVSVVNYVDGVLYVYAVGFSPGGKYVVSGGCDQLAIEDTCLRGSARVWDAETGKEIARMIHDDRVNSVAFSPDGKYVVSVGCDEQKINTACRISTARVWEAATGTEVARITHAKDVTSVAFSPDGKYIVSGSVDGEVTIREYRPEDLIADACSRVTRNLTVAEWKQYVGDALPYQAICENLPIDIGPEPTVQLNPTPSAESIAIVSPTPAAEPTAIVSPTYPININTASLEELDTLPGIGPTTAANIITFREQNGPFANIEDIINVSGIGLGTYERIKDLITVGP